MTRLFLALFTLPLFTLILASSSLPVKDSKSTESTEITKNIEERRSLSTRSISSSPSSFKSSNILIPTVKKPIEPVSLSPLDPQNVKISSSARSLYTRRSPIHDASFPDVLRSRFPSQDGSPRLKAFSNDEAEVKVPEDCDEDDTKSNSSSDENSEAFCMFDMDDENSTKK